MKQTYWLALVGVIAAAGAVWWWNEPGDDSAPKGWWPTLAAAQPAIEIDPADAHFFDTSIAPLLAKHCLECHDPVQKEGGLDLSRQEATLAANRRGQHAIVPGDAGASLVWQAIEADEMPPSERVALTPEERELLRQWIDRGAIWSADEIDLGALTRDERAGQSWVQRLTIGEYIETVRVTTGVDISEQARAWLPPDLRADGFRNTAYNLPVEFEHVEAFARLADAVVRQVDLEAFAARFGDRRELESGPMRQWIAEAGFQLLRGPLEDHEIDAYWRVAEAVKAEDGDFLEAIAFITEAMLQSPRFIYRIEHQAGDGGWRQAAPFELASRLSYMLWGAPPDEELLRAAETGRLERPEQVASQVERMLDDPRVVDRSIEFVRDWLNLDHLDNLRPNSDMFPTWHSGLAADMRTETIEFFREVVWNQGRPLADLMNAQVSFLTPRLAAHYRIDAMPTPAESNGGSDDSGGEPEGVPRLSDGLLALYTFEERDGDMVRDRAGRGEALDLKIADISTVNWLGEGLEVNGDTLISSDGPPRRLIDAVRSSREITVEVWATPASDRQSGPARLVTLSSGSTQRNVTLGQENNRYHGRVRASGTDANGLPGLESGSGTADTKRTHIVYTRARDGQARLYIDGELSGHREARGDFDSWDQGFNLMLANESSRDRGWRGVFHEVALYDRAISEAEVARQWQSGGGGAAVPFSPEELQAAASLHAGELIEAHYLFDEGEGDMVRDVSGVGEPLDLRIHNPEAVRWNDDGLAVHGTTLIASERAALRLAEAIRATGEITIEAWLTPAHTNQSGPARIMTLSSGTSDRNVTFGQENDRFDVRLRTSETNRNGMPGVQSDSSSASAKRQHVVYSRAADGRTRFHVDGELRGEGRVAGDLSSWDQGYQLALANEFSRDRSWQGTFHELAIYRRALGPEELKHRHAKPERYDLADVPTRGGLLTHGSLLTIGGDDASTVTRGLFILHDLLHSAVGSAPPGTDTTPVPAEAGLSRRLIAEQRLADNSCGGCHSRFEPWSFAFEKYNGTGTWAETDEHGNQLREDGEVVFPGEEQPRRFETTAELLDLLAASDRVQMNMTRKLTQFALGRPLVESDTPILRQIHAAAGEGGHTYVSTMRAILTSDLVMKTRTQP